MNTVLLVDDEHIELEYLNYILKKYPNKYKVVAMASSGKDAISYNTILKPDLAIVDISMPFINGIEAARKMLYDNVSLEIIINSAYREFDYAVDAMQMGIHTYLIKPSTEQIILKALDDAAKRKMTRTRRLPLTELSKRYTLHDLLTSYTNALFRKDHKGTRKYKEEIKELILMMEQKDTQHFFFQTVILSVEHDVLPLLSEQKPSFDNYLLSYSQLSKKDEISGFLDDFFEYIENFLYVHLFQKDAGISPIQKFIDMNYKHSDLSLTLLANRFYINKSCLATTFKEQTGHTVMDYIYTLRVEEVKKYLQDTRLPISEIAPLCGFQTANKLYTHFKEKTGLTPMEWRKHHDL